MKAPTNRNERGYIALARGILDHPNVGARKPYSDFEAWCWLLFEAQWKPKRISVLNRRGAQTILNLGRGQLSHSLRYMAKVWGWASDKRVRTFLNRLKIEAQIDTQTGTSQTVITICNYERYQNPESAKGTKADAQTEAQWTRNGRKEEERKKEINICAPREKVFDPLFLEFYTAYPKKKSRKDAAKAYAAARRDGVSHETIMAGLARAKPSWRDPQFIPYPASWLRAGGYEDETNVVTFARPAAISRHRATLSPCPPMTLNRHRQSHSQW